MPTDQPDPTSGQHPPSCPCLSPYVADYTHGLLLKSGTTPVPHDGWLRPTDDPELTPEWHEAPHAVLRAAVETAGRCADDALRLAILALAVLNDAPWTRPARTGGAWLVMYAGMREAGFKAGPAIFAAPFMLPDEDFFERYDTARTMAALLRDAHVRKAVEVHLPQDRPSSRAAYPAS